MRCKAVALIAILGIRTAVAFPSLNSIKRQRYPPGEESLFKRQTPNPTAPYTRIDVSGEHVWKAPGPNDLRGPCPALNALANHGYLPRDGVVSMIPAATVVSQIYGLGIDLSLVLSVYTTLLSGDIIHQHWSIGGRPPPPGGILGYLTRLLVGVGQGLSRSHNKFETDGSVTHGDYYLFNGDVDSVQIPKVQKLLSWMEGDAEPSLTLDDMAKHRAYTLNDSISTNPFFFSGPFSGMLVGNAGHCFLPRMMANFSAQYPNGHLDKKTLLNFLAVYENSLTGELTHKRGWERIPGNWYRRPKGLLPDYGTVGYIKDLLALAAKNPNVLKVGGNNGKVNTFTGVDLGNLFGAAYGATALLDPSRLVCFVYQVVLAVVPDILQGGVVAEVLGVATYLLESILTPLFSPSCPKISKFRGELLDLYPGSKLR